MERAAFGLLFFVWRPDFSVFGVIEFAGWFYTRGDARQGACVTPRDCMWRLSLDRHVIRAILRLPLGFKTALQVEITRKTLSC